MYDAPHEHAQHLCHRVLTMACPGFLTVPQGGMSAPPAVDREVRGHGPHSSFRLSDAHTARTANSMPTPNVPICHQNRHQVLSPSFLYRSRYGWISSSALPSSRSRAAFVVARKSRSRLITHQMPRPIDKSSVSIEAPKAHFCQPAGSNFSFSRSVTWNPKAATARPRIRLTE